MVLLRIPSPERMWLPISLSSYSNSPHGPVIIANNDRLMLFYRYTSHVVVTEKGEVSQGACPVQIVFCLKEQNKKKKEITGNDNRWPEPPYAPNANRTRRQRTSSLTSCWQWKKQPRRRARPTSKGGSTLRLSRKGNVGNFERRAKGFWKFEHMEARITDDRPSTRGRW